MTASEPDLPIVDGYTIDRRLGQGGYGAVYRATHHGSGRTVAIKIILPRLSEGRGLDLFQREINLTRQLRHPNIVAVLEHGVAQGRWYYVMEYMDGDSLRRLVADRGGILTLDELAPIGLDALDGLAHAHRTSVESSIDAAPATFRGVVHRDLKPDNIVLGTAERGRIAKVADFGLAKAFDSAGLTVFTQPGDLAGSLLYWPREHVDHFKYLTPPSDVFSMAAVCYECLTGRTIRDGLLAPTSRQRIAAVARNPVVPIRQRTTAIPAPVADVLDRALSEMPFAPGIKQDEMRQALGTLRYQDAGEFRAALAAAMNI